MPITKRLKDQLIKLLLGKNSVPRGLFELNQYFRQHGPIVFHFEQGADNNIIAISDNFLFGSIVTSGNNQQELDANIKDAILTSFEIPSSYYQEANIIKVGQEQKEYALA